MAKEYPIMSDGVFLTYEEDDPTRAKGRAVDNIRDLLEKGKLDKYLESILMHQDSISVILNNGIIVRYGFNRLTGRIKGITDIEAYI